MVAKKCKVKMRTSRNSSVMTLSNLSKPGLKSLSSENLHLPNFNVVISLMLPSNLPPLALSQYNCLTKKMQEKEQSEEDSLVMGKENKRLCISSPSPTGTLPSTCGSRTSSAPILNCDKYFSYGICSHSSPLNIYKQSTDLCAPDSPISIEDDKEDELVLQDSNTSANITRGETAFGSQQNDNLKDFSVLLQPVNSLVKTVFLNSKHSISASGKAESFSSQSMLTYSPKNIDVTSEATGNNIGLSVANNFETPDTSQLESDSEKSSTATAKSQRQRWIKSVNLEPSPQLKQWLSTKINSSTSRGNLSLSELDKNKDFFYVSCGKEGNKMVEEHFEHNFKCDRKHASVYSETVTKNAENDNNEAGNQPFQTSFETTHAKGVSQKLVASDNLQMSPLIPKPTSIFIKNQQRSKTKFGKKGFFMVRRNILHDHESTIRTVSQKVRIENHQDGSECIVDSHSHISDTCGNRSRVEQGCSPSRPEISYGKVVGCLEIEKSIPVTPVCKEGLFIASSIGQISQKEEAICRVSTEENLAEDSNMMCPIKNVLCESHNSQSQVLESTLNRDALNRRLLLLKTKRFVQHKKRKRTLSGSLLPGKKRLRTFSSCTCTGLQENSNMKNVPCVNKQHVMTEYDESLSELTMSADIRQGTSVNNCPEKSDDVHDWLLCDRSVDSIPNEDVLEVNSQTEAVNQSLGVVFQDHTYSCKSIQDPSNQHELPENGPFNSKARTKAPRVNVRMKTKRNFKTSSSNGTEKICTEKKLKITQHLSYHTLQKKYNLPVPLKDLTVNCERLIPDNLNILRIPKKSVSRKRAIHSKKKKRFPQGKRKVPYNGFDIGAPQPKKPRVPVHYRAFKPEQIKTIKHIGMRYRVAFHLWPQKYSSALEKINQKIVNQNTFWKTIQ